MYRSWTFQRHTRRVALDWYIILYTKPERCDTRQFSQRNDKFVCLFLFGGKIFHYFSQKVERTECSTVIELLNTMDGRASLDLLLAFWENADAVQHLEQNTLNEARAPGHDLGIPPTSRVINTSQ